MTIHLNMETVRRLAKEAVEAKGEEYVYEKISGSCVYVEHMVDPETGAVLPGSEYPSCLVGDILHRAGLPLTYFTEDYPYDNTEGSYIVLQSLGELGLATFDDEDEVRSYLGTLQGYQDTGETWGKALSEAEGKWLARKAVKDAL